MQGKGSLSLSEYNGVKITPDEPYPWGGIIHSADFDTQIYLGIRKDFSKSFGETNGKFIFDLQDVNGHSVRKLYLSNLDSCSVQWRAGEKARIVKATVFDYE